jgi:hypothetical protein
MFSTLGLLKSGKCPEGDSCTRPRCFFNHGPSADDSTPSKSTKTERKRPLDPTLISPAKMSDSVKRAGDVDSSGRGPGKVAKPTPKVSLLPR